ncbi:tRNA (uracil-5-)-methyltransferase [Marinobacterium marinum]|uniref:tRNA (Uracil-5-)-methyltransferase n=1 Tax=Marinobacterium marinum TaxID=2756129 RepID=A0A7W1WXE5_9GAMM|nr:tRNA (uracil-5-)-methyltransferase [Marinobacterium marinum]MBA4501831.1 tRNA (uracil-5-)-methyltransferase [Marinobacterium marinum]
MSDDNVVDFAAAGTRHLQRRQQEQKEERVDAMRARFAAALPDKPTPVKDYFKKKRKQKKR